MDPSSKVVAPQEEEEEVESRLGKLGALDGAGWQMPVQAGRGAADR